MSPIEKRHPECDGVKATSPACCSKYPDKCKDPKSAETSCSQNPNLEGCKQICNGKPGGCQPTPKSPCDDNPYGTGCNIDCGSANPPPSCANVPDCGKTPDADGCAKGKLNCAKYPTSPDCGAAIPPANPANPANNPPAKAPASPPADCAKNPDSLGCECATNPYGPSCLNAPDCGASPTSAGCSNLPNCANAAAKTIGCSGKGFDCTIYPRAPECLPNCASNPLLPGCNDCTFNKNATGCDICTQQPQAARCSTNFCTSNPDAPECSFIMTDRIKIHAITEGYILVTYLCNPSSNGDSCGSIIDWKGFEKSTVTFESSCSDGRIVENSYGKGFLYVCYKYETKEVFGVVYGSPDRTGAVSVISSKTITTVETFSSDIVNVFSTEDGGYCVTTVAGAAAISSIFIQKDTTLNNRGPFTIYQDNTATSIQILVCNIAFQSSGYSCVIKTTKGNQVTYSEIDFLSSGTSTSTVFDLSPITNNKAITGIKPLNYGGYVILTADRISGDATGFVVDNKGTYKGTWDLPQGIYTSEVVLPNNTIVAIPRDASSAATAESTGAVTIMSSSSFTTFSSIDGGDGQAPGGPGGYGSSKIFTTTPLKGAEVSLDSSVEQIFTILYTVPIISSTGNVSVYQYSGNNAVLKQTVSSTNSEFVSFSNDTTVTFKVLYGAIDAFNVPYYVSVDNDFVKEQSSGQNIIGIRPFIWNFTTKSVTPLTYQEGEDESAIIRLTPAGTTYYKGLSSQDKSAFAETMSDELAGAISCERTRLSTRGYQYDAHTKEDQIIMRVDIQKQTSTEQASSEKLVQDLDGDIRNMGINSLANGNSAGLLDGSNGAPQTEKLWKKYWGFLLAALLLFLLLALLFIFARLRCKKGASNFLPIFLSALIPIDIAFDIAFMSLHGRDFKWVLPTTVLFFILPIILNVILTHNIIRTEKARHRSVFNKWWKRHSGAANTFKTAAFLDTDALQVVSSGVGGVESLSAPFSEEGRKSILFATGAVVFFEDLPQLIIYSVYIGEHIKPAIVPILVLSSCLMVIVLKSIAILCSTCCYGKPLPNDKNPDDDVHSTSSSSSESSDNEKDDAFAPDTNKTTTNNLPSRTDRPQDGGDGPHDRDRPDTTTFGNIPPGKDKSKPTDSDTIGNIPPGKDKSKPTDSDNTFGNIPPGKDKPKPTDSDDKPTKGSPAGKNDGKSPKKPGIGGILPFGKKPKDEKPKDDTEEVDEIEETIITETTETTEDKPRIDSTIRDSTVENYDNAQRYLEATKKDDEPPSSSSSGGGGYSFGIGIPVHYGLGPAPKNKPDRLNIATGAAISGVTAAGGPSVRYIIIYLDDDEKKENVKPVTTIKTTTIKTTSSDGDKYITNTDNGREYITIVTGGKYITKYNSSEEYVTVPSNNDEYITTINGEEYITTITIIRTETTTTTESTTTTTDTTTDDEREYITQPRVTSSKGKGQVDYIVVTSSTESSRTFGATETTETTTEDIETTENIEVSTTTQTDENGNVIEIVKEYRTDENGVTTVTVTTTTKDPKGKVIDVNTETYTEKSKRPITSDDNSSRNIQREIMTETDENGNVIETVTETETDENGVTTVTVTTTKKDPKGKVIDTNTETRTEKSKGPITFDNSSKNIQREIMTEEDENGIITETVTETETDENGNNTIRVTTTKKDSSGKVLDTNTETTYGVTKYVEEPEETTITTGGTRTISYNNDPRRKQTRTYTNEVEDENGYTTVTTTTEVTEADGSVTTTVVTTKKDKNGNDVETNTETTTSYPDESDAKASGSKRPQRKQTRNFTMSETDEGGIVTEILTELVTEEDGTSYTKTTTIKKDANGNVIESNTETKDGLHEPAGSKTSKFTSSIIGPSIYQQGKEKLKKDKK